MLYAEICSNDHGQNMLGFDVVTMAWKGLTACFIKSENVLIAESVSWELARENVHLSSLTLAFVEAQTQHTFFPRGRRSGWWYPQCHWQKG